MPNELIRGSYGAYNLGSNVEDATADITALDARVDTAESDIDALQAADTALDARVDGLEASLADLVGSALTIIHVGSGGNDTTGTGSEALPYLTIARALQDVYLLGNTTATVLRLRGNTTTPHDFGALTLQLPGGYTAGATGAAFPPPLALDLYASAANLDTTSDERFKVLEGPLTITSIGTSIGFNPTFTCSAAALTVDQYAQYFVRIFRAGSEVYTGLINEHTATTFNILSLDTSFTPAVNDVIYIVQPSAKFGALKIAGTLNAPLVLMGFECATLNLEDVSGLCVLNGVQVRNTAAGTATTVNGAARLVLGGGSTYASLWTAMGYSATRIQRWPVSLRAVTGSACLQTTQGPGAPYIEIGAGNGLSSYGSILLSAKCYFRSAGEHWMRRPQLSVASGAIYDPVAVFTKETVIHPDGASAAYVTVSNEGSFDNSGFTTGTWFLIRDRANVAGPIVSLSRSAVSRSAILIKGSTAGALSSGVVVQIATGARARVSASSDVTGGTASQDVEVGTSNLRVAYADLTNKVVHGNTSSMAET